MGVGSCSSNAVTGSSCVPTASCTLFPRGRAGAAHAVQHAPDEFVAQLSPNGHWLVFSSKGRSPYTQMYLTHIDTDGNDSPPILIENATAANRAVNIQDGRAV